VKDVERVKKGITVSAIYSEGASVETIASVVWRAGKRKERNWKRRLGKVQKNPSSSHARDQGGHLGHGMSFLVPALHEKGGQRNS